MPSEPSRQGELRPVRWTERWVDAGGARLAVRDYGGAGRALIFVHGGPGASLGYWDGFPDRLAGPFRPIAYDQRGHGQSSDAEDGDYGYEALTDDLRAVVTSLDASEHVVVGHSWGAMVAAAYAARYPDCLGLVGVDGILPEHYQPVADAEWRAMVAEVRADPVESALMSFVGTREEAEELIRWARRASGDRSFSEAVARRLMVEGDDGLVRNRWGGFEGAVAFSRAADAYPPPAIETYAAIRCPVLLVMADNGKYGRDEVDRLMRRFPHLRVEWVPGGHNVQWAQPEMLADLITNFALHTL